MATTPLVERDVKFGEMLLRQLDTDRFPVAAAYWYHRPEQGDWQLIIESEVVDKQGQLEAYRRLIKAISQLKQSEDEKLSFDASRVRIVELGDRLTSLIRRMVKAGRGVGGISLSSSAVDGIFVEDSYVYRMEHRRKQPAH